MKLSRQTSSEVNLTQLMYEKFELENKKEKYRKGKYSKATIEYV
jgi:hypothetical protein